jgi:hypothetical protein
VTKAQPTGSGGKGGMRKFSFKILFICVFLPPLCYVFTIQGLEKYLQKYEVTKLNQVLIQNPELLYEGRYTVKEEVDNNIAKYLNESLLTRLGVKIDILVRTKDDRILYPSQFTKNLEGIDKEGEFGSEGLQSLNYVEVAAENFKILNDGLTLSADLEVKRDGLLSISILIFFALLSIFILQRLIKQRVRETEKIEAEQKDMIESFVGQLDETEAKLSEVAAKEYEYLEKIGALNREKKSLSKDIDGLLEEMENLETGLESQRRLKEAMESDVLRLREELDRLKGKVQKPKKKRKIVEFTNKRFKVLYKNLDFTDKAIEGFVSLTEEFQLKAEDVIHKLNEDGSLVSVRRKVFGKGGKMNVLEADFSYSGRIYFQKDSQPLIKIVVIGTKNTQEQDLAYLENLK